MPRVEFTTENKVATTNYDYPKLKLKNGERARILLLEAPLVEYVHTLRKPQVINGVPQMFTDKRRDGSEFEAHKMDFLSRPICLGDLTTLQDKGSDPKNCPMCKLAQTNPDMTQAPARRYAMHVIRYRTQGGKTDIQLPFSVDVLVWSFTDKVFNKIVDFKEEWGDLRKHDLMLGPCTNEGFQQFDISVGAKAAWMEDDERKKLTAETFKSGQIPDLSIACGSVKEKRWIEEDISTITEAWAQVNGSTKTAAPADSASLDADLSTLLGGGNDEKWVDGKTEAEAAAEKAATAPSAPVDDVDDLLGSIGNDEPEAAAPAAEEPKKEAAPAVDNFDDLLAGI